MENKASPDPGCAKCAGTGMYQYDENHSTICDNCCSHDQGFRLLEYHYDDKNGWWCCLNGCGHLLPEKVGKYYERFGRLPSKKLTEELCLDEQ